MKTVSEVSKDAVGLRKEGVRGSVSGYGEGGLRVPDRNERRPLARKNHPERGIWQEAPGGEVWGWVRKTWTESACFRR